MGLLDDAIREHLELKRRRGADAGAVAREERDLLGGERGTATALGEGQSPGVEEELPQRVADDADRRRAEPTDERTPDAESRPPDPSRAFVIGQETVELDMSSVLDETSHDDLERHEGTTPALHEPSHPEAPAGDVLEDTPDFLRHSPNEEQLWFEQRPPRDFDFDD